MQFWGDIILHRPDLVEHLPKDVIALQWGYEGHHPFQKDMTTFVDAGISVYVCPGTSSWNSIGGRTHNAYQNLVNAATTGFQNGAIGYLVTDWGDHGHWQQLPVSFFGFLVGAGSSWNTKSVANRNEAAALEKLSTLLSLHVFKDDAQIIGKIATDLGNAYLQTGVELINMSIFFKFVMFYKNFPNIPPKERPSKITLKNTKEAISKIVEKLEEAKMRRRDAELVIEELRFTSDLLIFACKCGLAYSEFVWESIGQESFGLIPKETREALRNELELLVERYKVTWLKRNREGGMKESVARFQHLLQLLR